MSDALASNFSELESNEDVIACCMAHGRRNFVKIAEDFPEECRPILTTVIVINTTPEQEVEIGTRLASHATSGTCFPFDTCATCTN